MLDGPSTAFWSRRLASIALGLLLAPRFAIPATAARVFVSTLGSDANDCSNIATPCKSVAAGITQVDPGGEVLVIASGGYTCAGIITKGVTMAASPGIVASFGSQNVGTCMDVRLSASDHITFRGLTFQSAGLVIFHRTGDVNVENCVFANSFYGIIKPAAAFVNFGRLLVDGCVFRGNFYGIYGFMAASIRRSRFEDNSEVAIEAVSGGPLGPFSVMDCVVSGNNIGLFAQESSLMIENCLVSNNGKGISAQGNSCCGLATTIFVSGCVVTGNANGVYSDNGAMILSRGNNTVEDNVINIVGTAGSYGGR
jgi:hypothetical protein